MPVRRPFLSYKFVDEDVVFADQKFVDWVYFMLSKQGISPFYWPLHGRAGNLHEELAESINGCDGMVALLGATWGGTQALEIEHFLKHRQGRPFVPIQLVENLPKETLSRLAGQTVVPAVALEHSYIFARERAEQIVRLLGLDWVPEDGLPSCYVVDYEKEFLEKYRKDDEALLLKLRSECGWTEWPAVIKEPAPQLNPITDKSIGTLSDDTPRVLLDSRKNAQTEGTKELTLPEARPRTHLRYPLQKEKALRVGILVSGGIAPGINAVIDGIVSRHSLYHERQSEAGRKHFLEILGYREGFKGLLRPGVHPQTLNSEAMRGVVEVGGSYLGTSRADELLPGTVQCDDVLPADPLDRVPTPGTAQYRDMKLSDAVTRLKDHGIDILYVIGGDGSMSCAHALWRYARRVGYRLSVVGIPKAMDNDILWVWQSFGFLSAVEEARQVILHMHTEVSSNPRVGIIQLFGSDSGFIASHAGYSTACDLVLIPEDPMTMNEIVAHVSKRLTDRFGNGQNSAGPYAIVVMAETALPADAEAYVNDPRAGLSDKEKKALEDFLCNGRRVRGQTPDELRRAGLKIVSRVLQDRIQKELEPPEYWKDFRVITNEPRHLIRSIPPSVTDVIFGERLGALAVDNAMAGYTDFMVSQWLTEFVLVPLPLVVLGRKRVPTNGIFWKSVLSKTGQRS